MGEGRGTRKKEALEIKAKGHKKRSNQGDSQEEVVFVLSPEGFWLS